MTGKELLSSIFLFCSFCVMVWWYFKQGRYWFQKRTSRNWPSLGAVIQRGAVGPVSIGKGALNGCFLGYAFQVNSTRYAGFFVIFCDEDKVAGQLQRDLPGTSVEIHYVPSDPNISYLADVYDPRFGWQGANQNPDYLSQAPAFDLADAMRK